MRKDKGCSITHDASIIFLNQFSKPEQHVFRQVEEPADIVWNEFGQLASTQQSRE